MKKRRVLIVDGYNVLNAWKNVQGMDAGSLSDARDALAARLMDYAGFSGQKVVLVYDAYLGDRRTRTEEQTGPLTVVYTQKNETADNYIERLCDQYARDAELGRVEVRVATSDLVEQMVVLGRHATRMSARELLVEVGQVSRAGRERMSARPKTRSALIERLPEDVARRLEAMRRGEEHRGGQMTLMYYERFEPMTDEEIVALAQAGDGAALEFLLNKYKNFVRTKARSYFLIGADHEDIVQEGMIGLYKAIRDFKSEKLTSFRALCGIVRYPPDHHRHQDRHAAEAHPPQQLCVAQQAHLRRGERPHAVGRHQRGSALRPRGHAHRPRGSLLYRGAHRRDAFGP